MRQNKHLSVPFSMTFFEVRFLNGSFSGDLYVIGNIPNYDLNTDVIILHTINRELRWDWHGSMGQDKDSNLPP